MRTPLATDDVASRAANLTERLAALRCNTRRNADGSEAPRLRDADARAAAASSGDGVIEDELRHLRRLAATGISCKQNNLR